ncbi:MAG: M20/M25/M40 family metallo-hydrolase [Thermoprotei archaeon]|jgi:LysW-gamma-L-lysine carboxypeptidase
MITHKELLVNMIKIYSPSNKEDNIRSYINKLLNEEFKADKTYIDNAGNIIGIYDGIEPTILLSSHMDTVPGEINVKVDREKIYGRGASDAKGPLATFLYSSYLLKRVENYPSKIIVVGTVDEEGESRGIKELPNTLQKLDIRPSYAIFGEPGGANVITIGYKGRIQLRIKLFAESYHASLPNAPNVIENMMIILNALKNYEKEFKTSNNFTSITITPTIITGGHATNVTPRECEIVLDIRIPPTKSINEFLSNIINIVKSNTNLRNECIVEDFTEPYQSNISTPLVTAFREAILQITNIDARFIRKSGTGEMNIFAQKYDIPIITYGPGDPKVSHTDNEHILLYDYELAIKIVKQALWKLQKIQEKRNLK